MLVMMRKAKKMLETYFVGDVIVSKRTLWLAGAVCLLAGIVYGLVTAPWTHGVTIGSYNQSDCTYGGDSAAGKEEDEK